jgi:hypothetical protein
MLEVSVEKDETYRRWVHCLKVIHNGEVIAEEFDAGEPEDNSFIRDYKWVAPLIKQAYELGLQDGKK